MDRVSYRFKLFGLKSRDFQGEVPFSIAGDLTRVLQGFGDGTLELDVLDEGVPANWAETILQWRSLIVVVDDEDRIVWHGVPYDRVPVSAVRMSYPCRTLEAYFLRRYVPSRAYVQRDQADIARDLASVCGDAAGIPLEYDCPRTGVLRNQVYSDDENVRVYGSLQELASAEDGFNWTVDVEWDNQDHSRVRYVFRTGYPHLGYRTDSPEHVFEMPGNIADFPDSREPWGEGEAATWVRGSGDGAGETKLVSAPVIDTIREASEWPRLEERRQFPGISNPDDLRGLVQGMAGELFGGPSAITLTVRDGVGTSLGDLGLGDSAQVDIDVPTKRLDEVQVVVGWSLSRDFSKFQPTLARLGAP